MWGRFFDSFATANDDTESQISGSHHGHHAGTDYSASQPAAFATPSRSRDHLMHNVVASPGFSEVHPDDSASAVNEHISALAPAAVPVDDGTYVFKFRTPSGRTHRFQARHDDLEILRDIVAGKMASDPFFEDDKTKEEDGFPALVKPDPSDFSLAYVDADGDTVVITDGNDVSDAVKVARKGGQDKVVLLVQGGKGWEIAEREAETKAKEVDAKAAKEVAQVNATPAQEEPTPVVMKRDVPLGSITDGEVFGIPRDLVLPVSLGFLGVIIVGVFIATRVSRDRY